MAPEKILIVIGEDLEATFFEVLGVVHYVFQRCSVWRMACVDSEAVVIIDLRMVIHEKGEKRLAELWNMNAEKVGNTFVEPVRASDFMNAKQVSRVDDHVVEMTRNLK